MAKVERPKIERPAGGVERPKIERVKVQRRKPTDPDFESLFETDGDPLEGVEYDLESLEVSAENEMSETLRQIREDRAAQRERFRVARDPAYFLVVCFQSHEQRDAFAQQVGWAATDGVFVNGLEVARMLGVDVPPIPIAPLPQRGKPHLYNPSEVW
jgi:hypothetical protein